MGIITEGPRRDSPLASTLIVKPVSSAETNVESVNVTKLDIGTESITLTEKSVVHRKLLSGQELVNMIPYASIDSLSMDSSNSKALSGLGGLFVALSVISLGLRILISLEPLVWAGAFMLVGGIVLLVLAQYFYDIQSPFILCPGETRLRCPYQTRTRTTFSSS